jgi:hypothetical protein
MAVKKTLCWQNADGIIAASQHRITLSVNCALNCIGVDLW